MSDFSSERAKVKKALKELNSLEKALKNYKKTGIPIGLKGDLGSAVNNKTDEIVSKFSAQIADGRELMQQILDTIAEIEEREREEKRRKAQEKEKDETTKIKTGITTTAKTVDNTAKGIAKKTNTNKTSSGISQGAAVVKNAFDKVKGK